MYSIIQGKLYKFYNKKKKNLLKLMVNDWTAAKECLHDFKKTLINEFHQNLKIGLSASHKLYRNTLGFINESLYSVSHNRILFSVVVPLYNTITLNLVVCWRSTMKLYHCSQCISRAITTPWVALVSKHTQHILNILLICVHIGLRQWF